MNLIRKGERPDAWLWFVGYKGCTLSFAYNDFLKKLVIVANNMTDEAALKELGTAMGITEETVTERSQSTIEDADFFLVYFSRFAKETAGFEPELAVAKHVIALTRQEEEPTPDCLDEIVREMKSIDQVASYNGSGWNAFKNAVRRWLEARGRQI